MTPNNSDLRSAMEHLSMLTDELESHPKEGK